jgi:hypothetical protein
MQIQLIRVTQINKMTNLKIIFLLVLLFHSCRLSSKPPEEINTDHARKEIEAAWKAFITVLEKRDTEQLIALSLPYILCTECLYRSESYQNRSSGDDIIKAYQTEQYVKSQLFYFTEFDIEFSTDFVSNIKDLEPYYEKVTSDNFKNSSSLFKEALSATDEVWIVTLITTPPGKIAPLHEGGSHLFPFLKTSEGFKFGGITAMP